MKCFVQSVTNDLEGLGPVHVYCLVKVSVSVSPQGFRFVESVRLYVVFLPPRGPPILLQLFQSCPELYLLFGPGSLYLFSSGDGWSLSQDSYARLLSASIKEC